MSYADRHPSRKWGERVKREEWKEGEEKEKSDGRVKAGGVQRGEENGGGRIRQRGETASRNTRQNEACLPVICHTL